jgi:NADH-quinone oxidoreductase subunit J
MHPAFFYILSTVAILAALGMITQRHPLTAAVYLVVCFLGLAGLYAMLSAPLLAILQVLVYAGAIMALVVFVIMLLNVQDDDLPHEPKMAWNVGGALVLALALFVILSKAIHRLPGEAAPTADLVKSYGATATGEPLFGGIQSVGLHLFNHFVFPFEVISILLTVAVVGVVVLAKRRI